MNRGTEAGKDGRTDGGKDEEERERGTEGRREGGREGGREVGGREGGREEGGSGRQLDHCGVEGVLTSGRPGMRSGTAAGPKIPARRTVSARASSETGSCRPARPPARVFLRSVPGHAGPCRA